MTSLRGYWEEAEIMYVLSLYLRLARRPPKLGLAVTSGKLVLTPGLRASLWPPSALSHLTHVFLIEKDLVLAFFFGGGASLAAQMEKNLLVM